ncbi:hypothetical protein B0T20DRAFT_393727 [Sordaria brevicollis]|uniref:DUF7707 domain-containing protein n=1 Tax=Sordaria brevicollis TaxID=83679 RepID=A0AAE0PEC4_SORBR|nr:hypothetical protein B0T20DRAFT_393727 [Sordaria brevicollis]
MVAYSTALLALASSLTLVNADIWIDPESVTLAERKNWCMNEIASCPLICQNEDPRPVISNECDADTLQYSCVCGNNNTPNLTEYSLTIPYHTCVKYVENCVNENMGNNIEQAACAENNRCGAKNPQKSNATTTATSTTASPSASSSGTGVYDGLAGDTTDGADSSNNKGGNNKENAAPRMLESIGATLVFGSLFAGFAIML